MTRQGNKNLGDRPTDAACVELVTRWLAGDSRLGDEIGTLLTRHALLTVRNFLGSAGPEVEDLAQDTVYSVMTNLRRRGEFSGSLINFTITVARNRCRNYLIWQQRHPLAPLDPLNPYLSGPENGPLDTLLEAEILGLLQCALDALDQKCRTLLRAFYLEEKSMEEIRHSVGLKSVQSIYYRRAACLKKIGGLLKSRLAICSSIQDSSL